MRRRDILECTITGFFLGGLSGVILFSLDFGRTGGAAINISDFLKVASLGAILALGGPVIGRKPKRIPSALLAGAFCAQMLLLVMLRVQQQNFQATALVLSFVAAAAFYPAFLAFIDNLSEPAHGALLYTVMMAGIGGMFGLTLCWLYVGLEHTIFDRILMGGIYGASIWTSIGIGKKISEADLVEEDGSK